MSELQLSAQNSLLLPPHGRWFSGKESQKLMLEVYEAQGGIAVGWDNEHGGKMFGVYSTLDKDTFMHLLLDIPVGYRHCYELLVENVPCRSYSYSRCPISCCGDNNYTCEGLQGLC
jgi:hypothetical protein